MGEKHPIVLAPRKNNHLAYLKREILGILNYLGKCLQKSSKVSSINNPMISGNIYLHVLIRVKLSNQAKRKSSNKKKNSWCERTGSTRHKNYLHLVLDPNSTIFCTNNCGF